MFFDCLFLCHRKMAGWTGLEPAASAVTGRRYNQLNYHPAIGDNEDQNIVGEKLLINYFLTEIHETRLLILSAIYIHFLSEIGKKADGYF